MGCGRQGSISAEAVATLIVGQRVEQVALLRVGEDTQPHPRSLALGSRRKSPTPFPVGLCDDDVRDVRRVNRRSASRTRSQCRPLPIPDRIALESCASRAASPLGGGVWDTGWRAKLGYDATSAKTRVATRHMATPSEGAVRYADTHG